MFRSIAGKTFALLFLNVNILVSVAFTRAEITRRLDQIEIICFIFCLDDAEMEEEEQGPSYDVVEQEFSFVEFVQRLVSMSYSRVP